MLGRKKRPKRGEPAREKELDEFLWWQKGVIYQIYPRSFQDSDGDGVGDLRGILERLDYLTWLGVDALWISPIYPSPMADFGYDVADYTGIHPLFGTMEDFDRLLEAAHERGLKLLLDLVPNHTSDRHPWFIESRSSRDSPKRNWYIWRDPAPDGGPPNNWRSVFGGSAWTYHEETEQYYYHAFLKEQPDLNWRNPDVQDAMLGVMRFWLDKGVDGFRIDVLWHLIKDDRFRNNPSNPDFEPGELPYNELLPTYSTDQPEVHDIVERMREVADEYDERVLIGEIYLPIHRLVVYYGENGGGVHLPFNFQLIELPWDAREIDAAISEYEGALPVHGWPNWVLSNHDKPRIATRAGIEQARVAGMLLLTLRGTPTMYYGDEIGMCDVDVPAHRVRDPQALNLGRRLGRDPARTPMQWDETENAGFTTGAPWLPIGDDYVERNVRVQQREPASMLSFYRTLLAIRRARPALRVGDHEPLETGVADTISYLRTWKRERMLVVLNFASRPATVPAQELRGRIELSTHPDRDGEHVEENVHLRGNEGVLVALEAEPTSTP